MAVTRLDRAVSLLLSDVRSFLSSDLRVFEVGYRWTFRVRRRGISSFKAEVQVSSPQEIVAVQLLRPEQLARFYELHELGVLHVHDGRAQTGAHEHA